MLLQATTALLLKKSCATSLFTQTWKNHYGFRGCTHNPLLSIFAWLLPGRRYIYVVFIAEVCQCCCVIWWKSFCALSVLVLWNSPVCQSYYFKSALNTIVVSKTKGSCHSREMQSQRRSCIHNLICAFNNLCPWEADVLFLAFSFLFKTTILSITGWMFLLLFFHHHCCSILFLWIGKSVCTFWFVFCCYL